MLKKTKKIKASFGILFAFVLIISIAGCIKKIDKTDYFEATGTKGLTLRFLENYPQDSYLVGEGEEPIITVIVEAGNQGAFPQEGDLNEWGGIKKANIKVSGYDSNVISMPLSKEIAEWSSFPGASYVNPEGSFDTAEFAGNIHADSIKVNKYEPTMLATICYPYLTKANPSVCIDPFPFDEQDKICEIGSKQLTSQGAPVAITRIDEEASANKIQFKISIKNVGNGEIIKLDSLQKCISPESEGLEKDDFDIVELTSVAADLTELACWPFAEGSSNMVKLYNGEGFVICSLEKPQFADVKSAYTTPLNIRLKYGYMSTISKNIKISKLTGVGPSTPTGTAPPKETALATPAQVKKFNEYLSAIGKQTDVSLVNDLIKKFTDAKEKGEITSKQYTELKDEAAAKLNELKSILAPTPTPITVPTSSSLRPNVFILEDDGTFNRDISSEITKKFYEKYPDKYDFVSIHYKDPSSGRYTGSGAVQYSIKGNFGASSGWQDQTSLFGSTKLLGYIIDGFNFNKVYVKRDPNNSPVSLIDSVYFSLLFHELTHYWGVSLPEQLKEATADAAHFRGSTGSWVAIKPTTRQKFIESGGKYYFINDCSKEPKHHDFDLYSMGLKSPNKIKEKLIVGTESGPSFGIPTLECDTPVEVPSNEIKRAFTIQDFINVLGPRIPSVADAQKDFNIAFIMIVPKGEALSQEQIDALNWIADKFPVVWYKSTEGRSTLNGITPQDLTPPVISNVKASAAKSSITVTWTTNEPSAPFIIYTPTSTSFISTIYPNIITNPPKFSTSHELTIESNDWTPVDPNAAYSVKVISIDENYNMVSFDAGKVQT